MERFYDCLTNAEKSEVRNALQSAGAGVVHNAPEDAEFVGAYRDACIVFSPIADVVLYLVGSGEYDELALSAVLQTIKEGLRATLKRPPSESVIHEKYPKVCLTIDEIIHEGILDLTDPEAVRRALKLKAGSEA
eukprot:CAMPEP_0117654546 /NCGR_PEP_ID=MMETSP0804-20121206/3802_1 /TAXON_ID=1074897 /ORGANISM="Tetraselmis astigmatica, Strain CCMP880" /LENGTH=133 /DNA_ID=CAMNT_0005460835 /DNA_START=365 /DNA_END=766 /DNA_ORIENTATION=-